MWKFLFPIIAIPLLFSCGRNLPEGARFINEKDTNFKSDIRDISAKINNKPSDPELYYLRANAFFYDNKFKDAIIDLQTAILLNDKSPIYHFRLAESYLNLDSAKYEPAFQELNKAIVLKTNYLEAKYLLAKLYVARQQYEQARPLLVELESNSDFKEKSMLLQIVSLKEQKDTIAAVKKTDELLLFNPNNFDATMQKCLFLLNKDMALSEKYVDKALKINEFSDEATYTKALILQRKNQFKDAAMMYEKAYKINPSHVLAFYNRAVIEYLFENYSESTNLCQRILELNPSFFNAFILIGENQLKLGNKKAAKENFSTALKLNPNSDLAKSGFELSK